MHFQGQSFGERKKFLCNRLSSSLDLTHAFQNSLLCYFMKSKIRSHLQDFIVFLRNYILANHGG